MSRYNRLVREARRNLSEVDVAFGDYRRANPQEAPKHFRKVHKEVKTAYKALGRALDIADRERNPLTFALVYLKTHIAKSGANPAKVMPEGLAILDTLGAADRHGQGMDISKLYWQLKRYLRSDELEFGIQDVYDPR